MGGVYDSASGSNLAAMLAHHADADAVRYGRLALLVVIMLHYVVQPQRSGCTSASFFLSFLVAFKFLYSMFAGNVQLWFVAASAIEACASIAFTARSHRSHSVHVHVAPFVAIRAPRWLVSSVPLAIGALRCAQVRHFATWM